MATLENNTIKDGTFYSLKDIVDGGMIPFFTSYNTLRNVIERDRKDRNVLKVTVTGQGTNRRYHIRGRNIKRFNDMVEKGKIQL